ncbi:DUF2164 family protein [Pseudoramibacter alactolyticus]|jgi:uncharacterized protein (DUF2164 family)|uniref:DUF2164 family protein n=1 Tax=Pseudoramibacter alactolyticus TaxID=113287 RepID=UPI0023571BB0|nr:DUF2164 family protein [Pseudoramibacter alactolyticus]MBM6969040.1 DUF2164 family protein [Pseudoramibacter alactolyticus]
MVQRLLGIDFTAEERAAMGREIAAFFEDERGEALGALACERLTDFFAEKLAPLAYNKGLDAARTWIAAEQAEMLLDFSALYRDV